jgi:Rps23 Pro-64 3,4-dihydroxylase Tpa1-like proline 4-hydroxylase
MSAIVKYKINRIFRLSVMNHEQLIASGPNGSAALSLSLLQVLMSFHAATSVIDAYRSLNTDVDLDEFTNIVSDLTTRGLLVRDDFCNLSAMLRAKISTEDLSQKLHRGHLVVIRDAFPSDFAEEVYLDLMNAPWKERGRNHHQNSVIDHLDGLSRGLTECNRIIVDAKRFASEISGEDCSGHVHASAAWYKPGDHASPHSDSDDGTRTLSFNWYLCKNWRPGWGGSLFWCPSGQHVFPAFNMIALFCVKSSNVHAVCRVTEAAVERRLTINGFWRREMPFVRSKSVGTTCLSEAAYVSDDDHSVIVV